ncbi:MAG: cytochrome b N-terminal domain-containing protein, partial [Pyrinomonadaceae bacterium]
MRTTAGVVAMLLALQILTGALLSSYYIPYSTAAHTTVAYIEKVAPAGAWIRALHHYGSQWLTLFLFLHILQMFWRAGYRRKPVGWIASVLLLMLIFSEGATGYSLPWDTRAFFSTRVAEGIAGGLPLVGAASRRWLLGGREISPLTLLRFFALHVLIGPAAIFIIATARLFIFRERSENGIEEDRAWMRAQLARQAAAAGVVFLALALFAARYHAPLGPAADEAAPGYLPRPGAQFLWLFQTLKYLPGRAGALFAVLIPGAIFLALLSLPFLDTRRAHKTISRLSRPVGATVLSASLALVISMTALAYIQDRRDPRTRTQLVQQSTDEEAFRAAPFEPLRIATHRQAEDEHEAGAQKNVDAGNGNEANTSSTNQNASPASGISASTPPEAYLKN